MFRTLRDTYRAVGRWWSGDQPMTEQEAAAWLARNGFRWIDSSQDGTGEIGVYRMTHEDPEGWWDGDYLFAAATLADAAEALR